MTTRKAEETFYDILKVDPRATISEIVAAYHAAKNAFARDSVATYSLFSPEETQSILDRLEEAYLTLSNVDKKREYDHQLSLAADAQSAGQSEKSMITDLTVTEEPPAESLLARPPVAGPVGLPIQPPSLTAVAAPNPADGDHHGDSEVRRLPRHPAPNEAKLKTEPPIILGDGPLTGQMLREAREKRGLSIDDVARITKIPSKFIRAIESDELRIIPARVYLQGFVKNLATLYRINPTAAVKAYLLHIDSLPGAAAAS